MQRLALLIIVVALSAAPGVYGQGGDPRGLLQEKLKAQFALTTITADRSDIVAPGAVVLLQKNGLMMYSTASPMPPANTYRNGKISQGGSGFGRDLAISMMTPGNATAADYPHRQFVTGEGAWVTGINVQKDGVVVRLYSDAYDGVRYYADLKFPFQKNAVPTPEQALATISEVLTVKPADNNDQAAAPPGPGPAAPAGLDQVAGLYVMTQAPDNRLQLNADGTLSLVQQGRTYGGTFRIEGNRLVMRLENRKPTQAGVLQGDSITDPNGSTWVKQPPDAAPAAAALPPLDIPAAPGAVPLQNEDVIKMAKAGIDDAIIIAKIGSSQCQFDTSTDALIRLKRSGVSTAVIKAIVGAGK